jgi:large subunit ribosomal protein L23
MSGFAQDVVLSPIITERSMAAIAQRKYTFKVAKSAGKIEIAVAVEKLFGVKVAKVNTMTVPGRLRRQGRYSGYTPSWKKAIVTLTTDSKGIAFFESMA